MPCCWYTIPLNSSTTTSSGSRSSWASIDDVTSFKDVVTIHTEGDGLLSALVLGRVQLVQELLLFLQHLCVVSQLPCQSVLRRLQGSFLLCLQTLPLPDRLRLLHQLDTLGRILSRSQRPNRTSLLLQVLVLIPLCVCVFFPLLGSIYCTLVVIRIRGETLEERLWVDLRAHVRRVLDAIGEIEHLCHQITLRRQLGTVDGNLAPSFAFRRIVHRLYAIERLVRI
mmetsp:Transcript_28451/g.47799  ORF Transcript_28451/g.47799 Transcript_28451/m.47799 type:complete len:225 (-) Transcript_28451:308-982(-)